MSLDSLARRQQAELDVTRWLADQGCPVIPPSPLVPREPVRRDGFSMTFWPFVEEDRDKAPTTRRTRKASPICTRRCAPTRAGCRSCPLPSRTSSGKASSCSNSAPTSSARPNWTARAGSGTSWNPSCARAGLSRTGSRGSTSSPSTATARPRTSSTAWTGNLYADFELVTSGPVEWDLAALGPDLEAAYDRGARRNGMRPLDEDVLRFVNAVGMLRVIASLTLVPQLPVLMDYLRPAVDQWRTTPFAGGLTG
ncbi:aminoglycoside phosphotransferase family protein [Streptomyces tricolor]|nr:aminoglycoside phosphotransferase family protein [Streptomyces tricolor]